MMTKEKRPQNKRWESSKTCFAGKVLFGEEYYDLYDCIHFEERAMERFENSTERRIDAEMMFCTTFEPLMEEDVFRNIVRKNSFFLNRQHLRWVTSRFQIRDRINHVAFIFEVRNDFKEIYLITVMVAGEGEEIQLKRSTICFDIAPSYASYDGTVVSQVTALDWRNLYNCRGIPMARVEITASDLSWEY